MTECQKKKRRSKVRRDLRHFSHINWRKETERTVGQCGTGCVSKQKAGKQLVIFPVRGPHFLLAGNMDTKHCQRKKKRDSHIP